MQVTGLQKQRHGKSCRRCWKVILPRAFEAPNLDSKLAREAATSFKEMISLAALSKEKGCRLYPEDETGKWI